MNSERRVMITEIVSRASGKPGTPPVSTTVKTDDGVEHVLFGAASQQAAPGVTLVVFDDGGYYIPRGIWLEGG